MPPVCKADSDDRVFRSLRARGQSARELGQEVCLIGHGQLLSVEDRDKLGDAVGPDYRPDGRVRPGHLTG